MNMMKNFKRRFSLSVPRTETIEESLTEFTEQFNQHNEGEGLGPSPSLALLQRPSLSSLTTPSLLALWGTEVED